MFLIEWRIFKTQSEQDMVLVRFGLVNNRQLPEDLWFFVNIWTSFFLNFIVLYDKTSLNNFWTYQKFHWNAGKCVKTQLVFVLCCEKEHGTQKSGTDPLKPAVNSDFTQLVITCSVNKHHLLSHTHVAFIKGGNHGWAAVVLAAKSH